jgi:phenylalanyl-tRNA synthetase beta chain
MICAEDELGLGESHDGIMVLDPSAVTGTAAAEHLQLSSDHVLEIGLTPNRTDAMGHVGVARDLIAALNHRTGSDLELQLPDVSTYAQDHEGDAVKVEVQAPEAALRYAGVTLTDVLVGPSPKWLKDRLQAIGLKPINNVVDVTNFVQHELAQPLHAFDADGLAGKQVVVRMAAAGEPFVTLDEKERKLDAGDLVIADGEKPACIAGVFGGFHSGVSDGTTTVFLESACFEPSHIRRTARRHGLNTDASFRFERGVDPELTVYALKRAALLLKEVAGARIASPITDIDNHAHRAHEVDLRFADCDRLTGIRIDHDDIVRILELLDFRVRERSALGVHLLVPAYRNDVHRPADVIEEVLRIHGYDRVPVPALLQLPPVLHDALTLESLRQQSGAHLAARGLREVMTPSLVNGERSVKSGIAAGDELVTLANPLSSELDVLRPTLLFGMLQAVAHNVNRQQRDLAFFERGRIYRAKGGKSIETETLGLVFTGRRFVENWRSAARKVDLFDAKEELEVLLQRLGVNTLATWAPVEHALLSNAHELRIKGRVCGILGEVSKVVLKTADVHQSVFFAEVDEPALLDACRAQRVVYAEVSRFPAVRRDLSLLLDASVHFESLRKCALNAERKILQEVGLFDVYQGDKLPAGRKSYALSFILQDTTRTLTDEQVEKAMGRIREALQKETGAELRA